MHTNRLVSGLVAAMLGWAGLAIVAPAADAQTSTTAATGHRDAPHDPATYYAGTEGLTGTALALMLNSIIDGHTSIPYTDNSSPAAPDVWKALDVIDADPNDPTKVIDLYFGDSLILTNKCGSSCPNADSWNREHTWPQSRGSFGTSPGPGTDLFHMRASRANSNGARGNLDFDNGGTTTVPGCPNVCRIDGDSFEPRGSIKGDIARGLFYMDVRYNGDADDGFGVNLRLWDQTGNSSSQLGKLSTLVAWSLADPPDERERWRNDKIDGDYQHNRNPFIDHPEWVCAIWGSQIPAATCANANQPPTATPQLVTTDEDTSKAITLSGTDPEGQPLTYAIASQPGHGSVSLTGATATYTPAADYNGPDSFTFTASDGTLTSTPATVSITVTPVNDPPTVQDIGSDEAPLSVPKNNSTQITLLGNDVDDAPSTLTYTIVDQPTSGTVSVTGNVATYTAPNVINRGDLFTYRATDPAGGQSTVARVNVLIGPSPTAPVATPVSVTTDEDVATTFDLTASDADGDALRYSIVIPPTKGTLTQVGTSKQVTYTPNPNVNGSDSFTWSVTDGSTPVSSTATITVNPVNDPPVANPGTLTTAEDTAKAVTLTASDVEGDPLTYAIFTQPAHGSVSLTGASATYTPDPDFHGSDSFSFKASDGSASSAAAPISVTVTPVNDAPTATAVTATTAEDTAVVIQLNGSDVDGDPLTFGVGSQPAHGTVAVVGDQATYTPAADYHGADSFTWTVSDGTVTISRGASVTVTPVNDAPTVASISRSTPAGADLIIALDGSDVDGDHLTYAVGDGPAHGAVVIDDDQATYSPDPGFTGEDSFTFTASDGQLVSAPATVTITVTPATPDNDPPTVDPASLSTTAGTPVTASLTTSDADGDTVVIVAATDPAHGSVEYSGTTVTYTPQVKTGTDSFVVTVSDGRGGTGTGTVDVTISARTATVSISTPAATRGKPVASKITATGPAGPKPGGQVTLRSGNTVVGTGTLNASGVASVTWTPTKAGTAGLTASYAGDSLYGATTSPVTSVPVAKSASVFAFGGKLKVGKNGKVKVTIAKVAGTPATGKVVLKVGSKKFTAPLKNGVAKFKIGKVPGKKKLKVKATYAGDGQYAAGKAKNVYKLK